MNSTKWPLTRRIRPRRTRRAKSLGTSRAGGWPRSAKRRRPRRPTLPAAFALYKELAAKYAGLEPGDAAQKNLSDPGLTKELEAWKHVAKVVAAEKALDTPSAKVDLAVAKALDTPSAKVDLAVAKAALEAVQKDFAGTKAAAVAQECWARIEGWAKAKAKADEAQKLEAENPPGAETAYKAVTARFPDSDAGKAARARLQDAGFRRELSAWALLKKMQKSEQSLVAVPGGKAQVSDKAWMAKNRMRLGAIRAAAANLKKSYEDTAAWAEARKIVEKYGIDLEKK